MLEVKRIFIGIQPVCLSPLASRKPLGMLIVCVAAPLTVKMIAERVLLKVQETPLTFQETDVSLIRSVVPEETAPLLSRGFVFPSSAAKVAEAVKKRKRMDRIASLLVFIRFSLKEQLSRLLCRQCPLKQVQMIQIPFRF